MWMKGCDCNGGRATVLQKGGIRIETGQWRAIHIEDLYVVPLRTTEKFLARAYVYSDKGIQLTSRRPVRVHEHLNSASCLSWRLWCGGICPFGYPIVSLRLRGTRSRALAGRLVAYVRWSPTECAPSIAEREIAWAFLSGRTHGWLHLRILQRRYCLRLDPRSAMLHTILNGRVCPAGVSKVTSLSGHYTYIETQLSSCVPYANNFGITSNQSPASPLQPVENQTRVMSTGHEVYQCTKRRYHMYLGTRLIVSKKFDHAIG